MLRAMFTTIIIAGPVLLIIIIAMNQKPATPELRLPYGAAQCKFPGFNEKLIITVLPNQEWTCEIKPFKKDKVPQHAK